MSTTLPEVTRIVQRCEALFEDLHFEAVKEWKAAVPGRKAIGYMPVYVPRELIHAASTPMASWQTCGMKQRVASAPPACGGATRHIFG